MFWRGISLEAKAELVFITGANIGRRSKGLTSQHYIEEILVDHVMPFSGYIGENFIFMQNNAKPHTAPIVRPCLEEVEVPVMAWPARSPDLNPIEHLWDELKKRVRSRNTAPTRLGEIQIAIHEEWDRIPQDFIKKLISSMKRRMQAVIQARGGNTSY